MNWNWIELKLNWNWNWTGTETETETELKLNEQKLNWTETELNWNWTETKLKLSELKLNWTETELNWNWTELKQNWNWNWTEIKWTETELNWNWNWTEIKWTETELNWNWTETELNWTETELNWTEQYLSSYRLYFGGSLFVSTWLWQQYILNYLVWGSQWGPGLKSWCAELIVHLSRVSMKWDTWDGPCGTHVPERGISQTTSWPVRTFYAVRTLGSETRTGVILYLYSHRASWQRALGKLKWVKVNYSVKHTHI